MCRGVRVQDEWTFFCGLWIRNQSIVILLAIVQFIVATVSFAQHVYSVVNFNKIFFCSFNESWPHAGNFLSQDVIIFDFGLFHELIQVRLSLFFPNLIPLLFTLQLGLSGLFYFCSSVALLLSFSPYISPSIHSSVYTSLFLLISRRIPFSSFFIQSHLGTCIFVTNPHPLLLWPQLIIQNAYCFGLVILTIATADKLLVSILHPVNPHLNLLILYFGIGTCTNHVFDYVLWHYYWHEEYQYISRTGKHVLPFWV
uniref:Polyprenol reductase n=1 Tax=Heterorhabditis bacteriophora TaxID=37862 RepID=A0A1I7XS34_HETBA